MARIRLPFFLWTLASLLLAATPGVSAGAASKRDFKQPHAYAVVIGISQYREEVIPKVPYAVKDAKAVADVLHAQGGIPKSHIRLLTDAKATGNDLRSLGDWLRLRVKTNSTVYVYYAGHGTPNPKTGEAYLVPWDGHPDFPSGLYPLKELYATLNELPASEVVVMLDSCFSGAAGRSVLAKGARPMLLSTDNPMLAGGKVIVLAAATGSQISSDYDKAQHGLFTYYLLNGLQGDADADKDRIVTLRELVPYVTERVPQTAVDELNREQTPILLPGEDVLGARLAMPLVEAMPDRARLDTSRKTEQAPIQLARAPAYETPRAGQQEITAKDGVPMALVPAGEFLYGNDDKSTPLEAFYLDRHEVTALQYAKFLRETDRKKPERWSAVSLESDGDRPVIGVDWHDADAYCRWAGKRLPTELEWEKAARGTDGRKYPWGNEAPTSRHANFSKSAWTGYATLAAVGSYEDGKSPFGIVDLAGNVWEWTASDFDPNGRMKVIRGGSWSDTSRYVRSAHRESEKATATSHSIGFRCALDAPKPSPKTELSETDKALKELAERAKTRQDAARPEPRDFRRFPSQPPPQYEPRPSPPPHFDLPPPPPPFGPRRPGGPY
jgi:formylglycine-generating enzyme required for sulfatase activity